MPKRSSQYRTGLFCRHLVVYTVAALGLLLPGSVIAQTTAVHGVVADEVTSDLIPAARVTLVDQGLETRTRPDGTFEFPVAPSGPLRVRVDAAGYGTAVQDVDPAVDRVAFLVVYLRRIDDDASLRIVVTDAVTGRPLSGARVGLSDLGLVTLAGVDGGASLTTIPPGEHLLEVTMLGYGAAQAMVGFEPGTLVEGEVELGIDPIELDGITVTGRSRWSAALARSGFYDRSRTALGRYLERTDIESVSPNQPSDLFRGMPGVRLEAVGFGRYALMSRRGFGGLGNSSGCPMRIYLDGVPWDGGIDDLPVDWIEGLEVYTGVAQIPPQYLGTGTYTTCGVVLIWSRR